ncbi:putative oxalocrotonate tautomerase [Mycena epipterygia]|nr:putative oxalocrotonate tautomerase [Mycena epipterygia]
MPLHRFFTPKGLYSSEDKDAIAAAVTGVYSALPPFYVVVLFLELDSESLFLGGKRTDKFLRITIEHVARHFPDDQYKRSFMDQYEQAIAPFTKGRQIDWEVSIQETERALWNENGMAPPLPNTEEENIWKRENRAVSPEEMEVFKKQGKS